MILHLVLLSYLSVCDLQFFFYFLFSLLISFFFFFNDTATTEIYTLSLHDALPICRKPPRGSLMRSRPSTVTGSWGACAGDRKSTRLNSSHANISYAVFCLKKKKKKESCWKNMDYRHIIYTIAV